MFIHETREVIVEDVIHSAAAAICSFNVSLMSSDLTLRRLMSYIYGAPILDVSRSHTMTQHSR